MSDMNFARYLTYLRQTYGITKRELAARVGVTSTYIANFEHERSRPPEFDLCEKIANALKISPSERKKLFKLAYEERLGNKVSEFQEAIKDRPLKESFEGTSFELVDDTQKNIRTIQWNELSKLTLPPDVAKNERENSMYKVRLKDSENEPAFKKGDELVIDIISEIENGKCYLIRDRVTKKVILRQLHRYGPTVLMRTTNYKIEDQLTDSFEILGMVLSLNRRV